MLLDRRIPRLRHAFGCRCAHADRVVQTLPRDRLRISYRDGAVDVSCVCGAGGSIPADDVDVLMGEVKAFIGVHADCVLTGTV